MNLLLLSRQLGAIGAVLPPPATLGFIPTAGEPYADPFFVREDRESLRRCGYCLVELDVTRTPAEETKQTLRKLGAVFVSGGNVFYLMQQLRQKGLADSLRDFVLSGGLYVGTSAGAVICGPTIEPFAELDSPEAATGLESRSGLDLCSFTVLPHFGKPKYLDRQTKLLALFGEKYRIIPLRDDEALLVTSPSDFEKLPSGPVIRSEPRPGN